MKKIEFTILSREELQATYDKVCERVKKYDENVAYGSRLTDFDQYVYKKDKKRIEEYGAYLQLKRDEFIFLGDRLVEYISAPYTYTNDK